SKAKNLISWPRKGNVEGSPWCKIPNWVRQDRRHYMRSVPIEYISTNSWIPDLQGEGDLVRCDLSGVEFVAQ
ncbi:MAG: hypothetical protein ACKO96_15995, partial [Flammeovirgaceae bacterium]